METIFVATNNVNQLQLSLNKLNQDLEVKAIMILMADNLHYNNDELSSVFNNVNKPIFGGIFPEIIFNNERKTEGTILIPIYFRIRPTLIDLNFSTDKIQEILDSCTNEFNSTLSTLFIFCDALSENKTHLTETLFNNFGTSVSYVGGGAGSLKFQPFPCIIDNDGLHQNAAFVGFTEKDVCLGVSHGWNEITAPLKVTKSDGNRVISLNWQPAFDVYKEIVEEHSGMRFTDENFFEIAKSYPLGIAKMDSERIIRDPYMTSNSELYLVDNVQEGEHVCIMNGNLDSLLEACKTARSIVEKKYADEIKSLFCIDCISRVLYMQNDFEKEIKILSEKGMVNGALTIGEIANDGSDYLEIFNKTLVTVKW